MDPMTLSAFFNAEMFFLLTRYWIILIYFLNMATIIYNFNIDLAYDST